MRCGIGTWRGTVAIALVAVLTAPPAGAASLRDALVTTYLTSPRLEAGRSELRQVDETVPQALSGYRPSLFLNGDLTGERSTVRQGEVFEQNRAGKSVNLSLRQNLYSGGGTQAQVSRAENQVQAQRSRLYGLEQQVLLDAVDAYTAAYRDQAVLDLALNNEERLKRQLEATRDRFDVGEVARTDVAQAEARLSRARADVEQAKADLASSRAAYQRVVGEEPTKLEEPKVLAELPKTEDETRAFAAQNPDIVAATFDLYAARDNVDVAFSDLLPSLDLRGELEYADEPTAQIEWGRTALLGLNLVHSAVPGRRRVFARAPEPAGGASAARRAGDGAPQRAGAGHLLVGAAARGHGGNRRVPRRGAGEPDRTGRRAAGGAGRRAHRAGRARRRAGAVHLAGQLGARQPARRSWRAISSSSRSAS